MKVKQIGLGALVSYIAIGFNIISGLLYTPWMINTIGRSNYALYALALSVINLFLLDFGIGAAVSKFLSGFYARNEEDKIAPFLGAVYKIYLIISVGLLVVFTIVYFNLDLIYTKLTPNELEIFKGLFIIVAVYSVLSFPFQPLNGILIASEKFIFMKLCNLFQKVLSVILIVISLILGGDVYSLVLLNTFSTIIFIVVKLYIINRMGVKTSFKSKEKTNYRDIFSYSVWMTVVKISQRFIFNIAPTILAIVLGSEQIAIFSIASTIEGYVYTFGEALSGMFMPEIARNYTDKNFVSKTDNLMVKVSRLQLYIVGLLIIGFICVGSSFVRNWMGVGYEQVYLCAVFLIIPKLIDIPLQIGRTTILITDNIKWQAFVYIIMAALNIVLSFPLSIRFGVYGTGVAVMISYLFKTIGTIIIIKRKVGLHIRDNYKKIYYKWLLPAIMTMLTGLLLEHVITYTGWSVLLLKVITITCVYALLLYIFVIDAKTKAKLRILLHKKN